MTPPEQLKAVPSGIVEFRRQEALLKTGALQDAIFNSAYFSSIATDEKGVIQIFNVGAEKMLGYTAADVVNRITPADISDPQELIARAAELSLELDTPIAPGFEALVFKASRGIEDIYDLTYVRKDGSRFAAIVSVTALRDAQDKVIGYLLIGTDNTARIQVEAERKRFEAELQEKNIELIRASRMKSEFLATMSHELRTPLNSIIGFSEALKDGLIGQMSDRQTEYTGDIFASGEHLLSLINDILDLSKVEAGMMTLELEPVDLGGLLSNSLTIVREKAAAQQIRLQLELGDGLDETELDVRKTKQIVYNLLSNAVKFSTKGGCVTLSAHRVPRSAVGRMPGAWPVHCYPFADNDHQEFVEIVVSDTGIGVAENDMGKLFQAFSQIDSSLARKFEGTGLGLAMVKQLAELHGGAVGLASAPGEGARFAAWLPLLTIHEPATLSTPRAWPAPQPAQRSGDRLALVVEDDDRAAELVRVLLEAEGFRVLRAVSGEDALLIAPQHELSLITLDIRLPGIDGWTFLLRLRQDDTMANVPVVIIAGVIDTNLALLGGAAAVLQKPVSRAQLRSSLASVGLEPEEHRTHTILVVDDDPTAVETLVILLPAPSYAVVRAFGGDEAIVLAQQLKPDLIVLDLAMPDTSGFDVVGALKQDRETAAIPIVVVTGDHATTPPAPGGDAATTFDAAGFVAEVRRTILPA
jgi:signal transduction histidine kinase/DNA-binding response OmpR family regulator